VCGTVEQWEPALRWKLETGTCCCFGISAWKSPCAAAAAATAAALTGMAMANCSGFFVFLLFIFFYFFCAFVPFVSFSFCYSCFHIDFRTRTHTRAHAFFTARFTRKKFTNVFYCAALLTDKPTNTHTHAYAHTQHTLGHAREPRASREWERERVRERARW